MEELQKSNMWGGMTVRKVTDWLQHKMQLYGGSLHVLPCLTIMSIKKFLVFFEFLVYFRASY